MWVVLKWNWNEWKWSYLCHGDLTIVSCRCMVNDGILNTIGDLCVIGDAYFLIAILLVFFAFCHVDECGLCVAGKILFVVINV